MINEFLTNNIYTAILKFDSDIDTEKAWEVSKIIGEAKNKRKSIITEVHDLNKLQLDPMSRSMLSEKLVKMTLGRKSFAKFYNSLEGRIERKLNSK